MKYNELQVSKNKQAKRPGRGISAGRGKTAGRGTKGQGARKSGGVRPGFEGGQMPLYMRLPKLRGFKSYKPIKEIVYTGQLNLIKTATIDANSLKDAGLVKSPHSIIKVIYNGKLETKKEVRLQSASMQAIDHVKKSGGQFIKVERLPRQAKKKSDQTKK